MQRGVGAADGRGLVGVRAGVGRVRALYLPKRVKKPDWLRVKLPVGKKYTELRGLVDKYKLNTICTSGSCPNMG